MKILAIETSCDETAVAIVENGSKILGNVVASSKDLHVKTGGIIPEIAAREQVKCMIPVINETLLNCHSRESGNPNINQGIDPPVKPEDDKMGIINRNLLNNIDAIAITVGPGLIGSLLVGVETAKTIAYVTKKPIVPVNHIFAHIYANWLNNSLPQFPAIALVVSGGHTELFFMDKDHKLKWLGGTRDDAAGEAFDKTARLLGLSYPGGPAIAAAAAESRIKNQESRIKLPRPMISEDNLDFSFSGLKTAVLREVNKFKAENQWNSQIIQHLAYEVQEAITDILVAKTLKAASQHKVKSILLGGGVAANSRLSEKFKLEICPAVGGLKFEISLHIPPPSLCTDNAAYIGSYAYFHFHPIPWQKIQAQPSLEVEV